MRNYVLLLSIFFLIIIISYLIPNKPLTITLNQIWSANLWYTYSITLFGNIGTFRILTDVIFVWSDIYQLTSSMRKSLFSYSKSGTAPLWLDSLTKWPNTLKQFVGNLPTNCLSVFGNFVWLALKGFSEETDFGKKYREQKNAYWSPKNHNMTNRRIRVCSSLLQLRNKMNGNLPFTSNKAAEISVQRLR